jgi:hypothetical protein
MSSLVVTGGATYMDLKKIDDYIIEFNNKKTNKNDYLLKSTPQINDLIESASKKGYGINDRQKILSVYNKEINSDKNENHDTIVVDSLPPQNNNTQEEDDSIDTNKTHEEIKPKSAYDEYLLFKMDKEYAGGFEDGFSEGHVSEYFEW